MEPVDNGRQGTGMEKCPKCSFPLSDGAVECPACGVVVAKYPAQAAKAPRATAAAPTIPSDAKELPPTFDHPEVSGPLIFFVLFQIAATAYVLVVAKNALLPLFLQKTTIAAFSPSLPVAANFEVTFKVVQIAASLFGVLLILARALGTPSYWRVLLMLTVLADIACFGALSPIPEQLGSSANPEVALVIKRMVQRVQVGNFVDLASALLWLIYWRNLSQRVKNIFRMPLDVLQARRVAKLSWLPFLLALGTSVLGRRPGLESLVDLLFLLFFFIGFGTAVFALAGVKKYGRKGILLPALASLILYGFFLFVWITNFLAAEEQARSQSQSSKALPTWDMDRIGRHLVPAVLVGSGGSPRLILGAFRNEVPGDSSERGARRFVGRTGEPKFSVPNTPAPLDVPNLRHSATAERSTGEVERSAGQL